MFKAIVIAKILIFMEEIAGGGSQATSFLGKIKNSPEISYLPMHQWAVTWNCAWTWSACGLSRWPTETRSLEGQMVVAIVKQLKRPFPLSGHIHILES